MKAFSIPYIGPHVKYRYRIIGIVMSLALLPAAYSEGPTFEVATIKSAPSGPFAHIGAMGGPGTKDPARWTCENMSLSNLVSDAFNVRGFQLQAPSWLDNERFNIMAKVPEGATKEQFLQMQQNLLIERFGLKFHREQKEVQGYELVVAKKGPKFKVSEPEPPKDPNAAQQASPGAASRDGFPSARGKDGLPTIPKGATGYWVSIGVARGQWVRTDMAKIAAFLSDQMGQPVADSTGLKGEYDLSLEWTPAAPGTVPTVSESSYPSLLTALQEQVGLKLQRKKVTIDILVIDYIEKTPTEN